MKLTILLLALLMPATYATALYADYNVLVFGNFTSANTDTGGALAAGNTINITNYTVVSNALGGALPTYTLVGGGDVQATNGQLSQGSVYDPVAGGLSNFTIVSGSVNNTPPSPIDFVSVQSQLSAESTQLAGLASNGTAVLAFSTLTLTGTSNTSNVFSVTAAQLSGNTTINIVVPVGSTAIVNVSGTTGSTTTAQISFNGHTINGNATDPSVQNLVWNYDQATGLTLSGGVIGTVLAPFASVTGGFTQLSGQLIAQSYSGNTEFHNFVFDGQLPASDAPEPGSLGITGVGLITLAYVLRQNRSRDPRLRTVPEARVDYRSVRGE